MSTAKDITDRLIHTAKNMSEFCVERDEIVFNGSIPFDITQVAGHPFKIKVHALSQDDAEQRVDDWLYRKDNS